MRSQLSIIAAIHLELQRLGATVTNKKDKNDNLHKIAMAGWQMSNENQVRQLFLEGYADYSRQYALLREGGYGNTP